VRFRLCRPTIPKQTSRNENRGRNHW
jgi:hypothetical protein